jgi:hypothetical protein
MDSKAARLMGVWPVERIHEEFTHAFEPLYGLLQVCNDADIDMIVGSMTRRCGGSSWCRR